MINRYTLLLLFFFILSASSFALVQDSCRRIRISEAFMGFGDNGVRNEMSSPEDFRKLAPGSVMLNQNFNYYTPAWDNTGRGGLFTMGIGLKSGCSANAPVLRIAAGYGAGTYLEGRYYKFSTFREDTLTSSKTGQMIFVDSTRDEQYTFKHKADLLKLDISFVWRTSNPNKLKLFAGIGITAGTSLNATTTIYYNRHDGYGPTNGYGYFVRNYGLANSNRMETFTQKNQFTGSVYCPFGLDYQLSKSKSFWKLMHPFIEARALLYYRRIPEIGPKINSSLQMIIGQRVVF